jgi:hypothetical protein
MKFILSIIFSISLLTSQAQIFNSMSANSSGMYFYSVDSVISYLKLEKDFGKVYVKGQAGEKIDGFPFEVRGVEVRNLFCEEDCVKQMGHGDILLTLSGISIIRDQYSLSIRVQQKKGGKLGKFADFAYFFQFKYLPESQTYILRRFNKGVRL